MWRFATNLHVIKGRCPTLNECMHFLYTLLPRTYILLVPSTDLTLPDLKFFVIFRSSSKHSRPVVKSVSSAPVRLIVRAKCHHLVCWTIPSKSVCPNMTRTWPCFKTELPVTSRDVGRAALHLTFLYLSNTVNKLRNKSCYTTDQRRLLAVHP
jgi:hypothetical protein